MLSSSLRQHFPAQEANPFTGLVQSQLGQAKKHQASAWQNFSELVGNREMAPAQAIPTSQAAQASQTARPDQSQSRRPLADDLAQYGFADNVPRSLIDTESGGNFDAENDIQGAGGQGHFGILQFGRARLQDAMKAGVIPQGMTPQQFKQDRKAQVAAANWHFNDIDNRIKSQGFDRLIGESIGGTPITMNGMRSMAHLGGFGGLSKFISTGGEYNPSDAFGTSLAKYGRRHSNS